MRRSLRFAPLAALGLSLCFTGACRQTTTPEGKSPGARRDRDELALPDPLALPADPQAASWIAQPQRAVAMVARYSPVPIELSVGVERALGALTEPALAGEIARAVNLSLPFANVVLDDGQEVIRLSLKSAGRTSLAGRFTEFEPIGDFGAVKLPRRPSPEGQPPPRATTNEWLAWIDEGDGGTLVLANSLAGLVTGRTLKPAYGKQPIYFTADPSALPIPIELPFSRVTGRGDLSSVVIEVQAIDGQDPFTQLPIAPGTLGGLLDGPQISAGASTRYADHEALVHEIIIEVDSIVSDLPFMLRGIGKDVAAKLNATLRTWDGRVLAAMGPRDHLRLAYGATDVENSRVAVLRLLQAVVSNVSLARNFTNRIPKMTLRRRVAKGNGIDVELFVLHNAANLSPQLRVLVDRENRLNVAMAWSKRAGGGMIVIGADAPRELADWLDHTKASASNDATNGQLFAASVAAEPEQLRSLLELDEENAGFEQLLGLAATGPQWRVSVDDEGAGKYRIELTTPGPPKPPREP